MSERPARIWLEPRCEVCSGIDGDWFDNPDSAKCGYKYCAGPRPPTEYVRADLAAMIASGAELNGYARGMRNARNAVLDEVIARLETSPEHVLGITLSALLAIRAAQKEGT